SPAEGIADHHHAVAVEPDAVRLPLAYLRLRLIAGLVRYLGDVAAAHSLDDELRPDDLRPAAVEEVVAVRVRPLRLPVGREAIVIVRRTDDVRRPVVAERPQGVPVRDHEAPVLERKHGVAAAPKPDAALHRVEQAELAASIAIDTVAVVRDIDRTVGA